MRVTLPALLLLFSSLAGCDPVAGPDPATLLVLKLSDTEAGEDLQDLTRVHDDKQVSKTIFDALKVVGNRRESNHPASSPLLHNELDQSKKALNILDHIRSQETDAEGRICMNKTMLRRETQYEEIMRCDHTYDERCHTSYVTNYEPHYEEECEEKFRKVCMISYEQNAVTEEVEECTTPLVPDCTLEAEEVCRIVFDTVCDTKQVGYEVEEQFPVCTTVNMTKCEDVTTGLLTEERCVVWPTQQCTVENRTVTHSSPKTECRKEPRQLCAPGDCPLVEGGRQCEKKMKTSVVETPSEQCDLEPQQVCKQITKLVPQLKPTQECVQVPKEVCAMSRVKPRVVNVPYIQKWCFKPEEAGHLSALVFKPTSTVRTVLDIE